MGAENIALSSMRINEDIDLDCFYYQLAIPDLLEAVSDSDVLVFVVPHQFIIRVCDTIKDKVKKEALGVSLIKVACQDETSAFLAEF